MTDTQTPEATVAATSVPSTTIDTSVEESTSKSTLFVRGLPYDATNEQLEAFFSEVGPVRSCFVVLDRNTEQNTSESSEVVETGITATTKAPHKNKGYGFVQFVLPDDADRAINELRGVKFLKQRPLLIEKAVKKSRTYSYNGQ